MMVAVAMDEDTSSATSVCGRKIPNLIYGTIGMSFAVLNAARSWSPTMTLTNDLTNPDVIAALEIAEVKWTESDLGWVCVLAPIFDAHLKPRRLVVYDSQEKKDFRRFATPADLDHALVYWLFTWLPKHGFRWHQWTTIREGWKLHLTHVNDKGVSVTGSVRIITGWHESPLLAVAAAVVQVGKETDNVRSS